MRAFFHPDQQFHDPQQFMRAGKIAAPKDVPARTESLQAGLAAAGLTCEVPPDCGRAPLEAVHSGAFLDFLATAYDRWRALPDAGPEVLPNTFPYWNATPGQTRPPCPSPSVIAEAGYYLGDLAVPLGPNSWRAIAASASSAVAAADAVCGGARAAYALCRPSGHHARADRASGFCYVNNAAVAAQRLRSRFAKVGIVDVDAHHGDGTQAIFYARNDVVTASVHADPAAYYPFFTGYAHEQGAGEGLGANLNLPLPPGAGDDAIAAATAQAAQAVQRSGAAALVIALGFDAHAGDPIGILKVSTAGYGPLGEILHGLGLPTVIVQEGGYNIPVLGDCLARFLAPFS